MTAAAAQIAGAVGSVGLALLIVTTRRDLRIAGLVAWALGCAGLPIYLAPHGHHRVLAAAAVLAAIVAVGGAWAVPARPLAARGRDARRRAGSDPGARRLDTGESPPAALRRRRRRGDRPRLGALRRGLVACASSGRSRGRSGSSVGWEGISILWTKDVRQGAIELLFFVLPFGLLTVALARLVWSRGLGADALVQLALMGLVFAVIGIVQYQTRTSSGTRRCASTTRMHRAAGSTA